MSKHTRQENVMVDVTKNEILSILKNLTDQKERTDRELVKIESRLENRIIEVKSDPNGVIMQVRTYLKKCFRNFRINLKNDIKEIRNTLRTMTNLLIICNIGVFAVIIPLTLYMILQIIEKIHRKDKEICPRHGKTIRLGFMD